MSRSKNLCFPLVHGLVGPALVPLLISNNPVVFTLCEMYLIPNADKARCLEVSHVGLATNLLT